MIQDGKLMIPSGDRTHFLKIYIHFFFSEYQNDVQFGVNETVFATCCNTI